MTHFMIFQINTERDTNRVAFEPYGRLARYQGSAKPDKSLYDKVYETDMNVNNLEDIYRIFNVERPKDYRGRSLSVSDIVTVTKSNSIGPGSYYCDSIGFKKLETIIII